MENHNGRLVTIETPDLHVLRQTAASGRFAPALPEGISSIMCGRNSIIPAANDDEVIWLVGGEDADVDVFLDAIEVTPE